MLQIYCLSIVLNAVLGYLLAFTEGEGELPFHLDNETVRLVTGILASVTGLLKILSPVAVAGNVPVVGDLLPALAGIAGGGILILDFYRRHSTVNAPLLDRIAEIAEKNRKLTGFVCLGAAALHLIFYSVLFL